MLNKRTLSFFSLVITITLLASLLAPFGTTVQAASQPQSEATAKPPERVKPQPNAIEAFSASSGMDQQEVQAYLDQGLTLGELKQAVKETQSGTTLDQAIARIKPDLVNNSTEAKSTITSDTSKTFAPMVAAAVTSTGDYSYVNTKPDEAPYMVSLDQETLSTLTGSLSLQATDLTLPGRNGLSFSLTRVYDSSSSQFGQLGFVGGANSATEKPLDEKMFPIGKGWSWNLSFIEKQADKKYLHLAGGGTYEISGTTLKGYPWKDLSMAADTSVTVGGLASTDVLISISGIKQYFSAEGQLLQISDLYGNTVRFTYSQDPTYGKVLTGVEDAVGNTLTIAYSTTSVVLTAGSRKVTYYKTEQNGKELLTQVIDPLGRAVTYDYSIKTAKFNLIDVTPTTENPYALLTGITHPTGAKTEYSYEDSPTTRYIGEKSVNQVFRVKSRQDRILYSNGTSNTYRAKTIAYTGDVGSEYAKDLSFSTTVTDGAVTSTFVNDKDYIDADNPPVHYNTSMTAQAGTLQRITNYTYDRARKWYYPVTTTRFTKDTSTGSQSAVATSTTNYDDYAQVTTKTDPMGGRVEFGYDPTTHWLSSSTSYITDTQKQYTAYTRNEMGSVTQVTVRDNDASGTLLQQVNYGNFDSYGNAQQIITKTGDKDSTTLLEYGAASGYAYPTKQTVNVTNVIDNKVETIAQQYDFDKTTGTLLHYWDDKRLETSYEYDILNRVTKAIHADLTSINIRYDDFNNILTQTDETGVTSITTYNPLGMKVESGIVENGIYKAKAKMGYNALGQLESSEDALGNRSTFLYDEWGRAKEQTAADTSKTSIYYDDIANTKTSTDPENNQVKETYDLNGRTTKQDQIFSGRMVSVGYAYDKAGQVRTLKDANQETTTYSYDSLGRLTSVLDPKQELTQYSYNMRGNLSLVTYPDGKTISKDYDELGRLTKATDSEGKTELTAYDGNGNKMKLIDKKGQLFTYAYHPTRDWLLGRGVDGQNQTITYTYDDAGRRRTMTDPTGTTKYDYVPGTGQLQQVTYPDSRTIQYTYDAAGNRQQMTDPFGANIYYQYDTLNRLTAVSPTASFQDADATYNYYKNGMLKEIGQKNGVKSAYTYEGIRIKTLNHTKLDGTLLNSYNYATDNNGNITSRTENGTTVGFTYDKVDRIDSSNELGLSYTYDSQGNRSEMTSVNPAESPDATYMFDSRDQLTGVTLASGQQVMYTYNGDGLLYERTENGETTRYYYDGTNVIAEGKVINGVVTLKARYIRGAGLIAREDANQQKAYYLQNGHGDIVELRSSDGNTRLNQYTYDIWGNPLTEQENISNPFRYSGEMWDSTTKLQYLRARWYDPSIGRFMNKDIYEGDIKNPLSLNLYTYVENNPIIHTDPTGRWCESPDNVYYHTGRCDDGSQTMSDQYKCGADDCSRILGEYCGIEGCDQYHKDGSSSPGVLGPGEADAYREAEAYQQKIDDAYEETPRMYRVEALLQLLSMGLMPRSEEAWGMLRGDLKNVDISSWNKGTYDTTEDSLIDHFIRHPEVEAKSPSQYLRKAEGFKQNLKGATKSPVDGSVEGVVRYKKNGKYIDLAPDGTIVSYGGTK